VSVSRSRTSRAAIGDDGGAVAVEFAFVVPLLVGLLAIVFTIGQWTLIYQQVLAGAREGARHASITQSTVGEIRTYSTAGIVTGGFSGTPVVTVETWSVTTPSWTPVTNTAVQPCNKGDGDGSERRVRVTITAKSVPIFPFLSGTSSGGQSPTPFSFDMNARGVFRCE
jgi:Flp pilus assembly protein TadG